MNKMFSFLTHTKRPRIRFLILFLLVIYIPITLNILFVQAHTIDIIKKEKMEAMEHILQNTVDSVRLTMKSVGDITKDAADNRALRKTVQDFQTYAPSQKERLVTFYDQEFEKLKQNPFINEVFCITTKGDIYFYDKTPVINPRKFLDSAIHQQFIQSEEDEIWQYGDFDFYSTEFAGHPQLFLIQKLKGIGVAARGTEKRTADLEEAIGYLFVILDIDSFKSLFETTPYELIGEVSFYNTAFNPVLTSPIQVVPADILEYHSKDNRVGRVKEININKTAYALGLMPLNQLDWYIANMVPIQQLTWSVQSTLRNSYWLIVLVSIIVAILIVIEVIVLSRMTAEKEMAHYRLMISEDMIEKLRVYKHDFVNHLQIIHSLIEMNQSQKAVQYLKKVAEEGKIITQHYEIGVPELESAIFSSIISAEKNNIEVKVDAIQLSVDLGVNIYDLVKIITNLIKNAMHALTHSGEKDKLLTIRIYSELDEYVFKISNNTPIIPPNLREKIFEKGFTTKGSEGSGLGLYIVSKLVRKNHGSIELVVDEQGNHFIVRFLQYREV